MKAFLTAMLVVGAIVGAGFASGAEIAVFFARFGYYSFPMIAAVTAMFFVLTVWLLKAANYANDSINTFAFPKIHGVVEFVMAFNCFVSLSGMMAGGDAAGQRLFDLGFPVVSLSLLVVVFVLVLLGIKGVMGASGVLVPLIFVAIIVFSAFGCAMGSAEINSSFGFFTVVNPFLYAGFNMLLAVGTLQTIRLDKRQILATASISTLILTALVTVVAVAVLRCEAKSDSPLMEIAAQINRASAYIFFALTLCAILTSMLSSSFTLLSFSSRFIKKKPIALALILAIGFAVSRLGFSNIIQYLYPLLGVFGLLYYGAVALALRERRLKGGR